jgi:hypothetical protein
MQLVFYLLAALIVFLVLRRRRYSNQLISIILAFWWLWMGIVYHLAYFSEINKAARIFGAVFVIQGILFLYAEVFTRSLSFKYRPDIYGIFGIVFILYALSIYPLLGYLFGHGFPNGPTLGVPCPTTIFTFGVLLWTEKKVPKYLLVIPFVWSLIGFSAALSLGVKEDYGLFVAGVIGTILILLRDKKSRKMTIPGQN